MKVTLVRSARTGECRVWLEGESSQWLAGVGKTRGNLLPEWNDDPARTIDDVRSLVKAAGL